MRLTCLINGHNFIISDFTRSKFCLECGEVRPNTILDYSGECEIPTHTDIPRKETKKTKN